MKMDMLVKPHTLFVENVSGVKLVEIVNVKINIKGEEMKYDKYHKDKLYSLIWADDLKKHIKNLLPRTEGSVWAVLDLRTNQIKIENFNAKILTGAFKGKGRSNFGIAIYKSKRYLCRKLGLMRGANKKDMNTELIKHVWLRAMTREKTDTYIESTHKYEILTGLIDVERMPFKKAHISDNIGYIGDVQHFFYTIGMKEEAKYIWDLWMESKFTDKDRLAVKTACREALNELITIGDEDV